MAEVVLAQELPDVLDRIEFRTVGRQMQQADVVRHLQLIPWLVPAGAIEHDHRVVTVGDVPADFAQMQVHGVDVDPGQDQGGADAPGGADGIVTLTWIGREKTSKGRKSAFHAALRTHVSCFQTSNALVR